MMFLGWVDDFTGSHLRLLALLNDPPGWFARHSLQAPNLYMGGHSHIVEAALPEMAGRRDLYDRLLRELRAAGLVIIDSLHSTQTGASLMQSTTSPIGKRFMNFISDPRRPELEGTALQDLHSFDRPRRAVLGAE